MRRSGTLALLLCACTRTQPLDVPDAPASPQAKAVPAQLANVPAIAASGALPALGLDAGPPPVPLRGDRAVPGDSLGAREITGYTLTAVLRSADPPPLNRAPEVSQAALEAARRKSEPHMTIDFGPARARILLETGFVLPDDTELRARADRYGFFLVTPGGAAYRTASPGSLRALFGERRLDVAPLSLADVATRGEGPRRNGYRTHKVEIVTRAANATFEIARLPDSGEGGALVCRALLDLVNAPPSSPVCGLDEAPLHAELRWTTHGALTFDVITVQRRTDIAPAQLAAPPPSAVFLATPPPPSAGEAFLTKEELAQLHAQPVEIPDAGADPALGLVLVNATDEARVAWIDGIPAAWVAPGARIALQGPQRGRYQVAWRTFLGDITDAPETVVVPGTSHVGSLDGGI